MPRLQPARQSPRQSLATKIIFFVFLSTFVTALAVSLISIHSTYAFLRQGIDKSFPAVLERSGDRVLAWLEAGRTQIEEIARDEALRDRARRWASGETPLGGDAEPIFREDLPEFRTFSSLVVLDAEGHVRSAVGTDAGPLEGILSEVPELDSASLSAVERRSGVVAIASAPLLDASGQLAGSVHGIFRRDGIAAQLRSDLLGSSGDVYLIDDQGRALAAGRHLGESRLRAFPAEIFALESSPAVREFSLPNGRHAIGATRRLEVLGWSLLIQQPFDEAFAPVYSVMMRIFAIDLAIILLFSLVAYKITAAVVRPIAALYEGARRISQGELEVEIPDTHSMDEVGLLTRTFNDMTERLRKDRSEIESAYRRLQEQSDELQRANEVLEQLSITDGLTRLHNHRYFQEHLTREIKRVSRTGEPLAMIVIDIDDFKRLNDRLGHAAGDELLLRIARILNESVRASDLLARYGGEEFVVLAPGTDLEGAVNLAEKIRTSVAESSFILDDSMRLTRVTISLGVACFGGSRKDFFDAADRALYRAKAEGKNCVIAAGENA